MKTCSHCELEFPDGARYCVNCGRPLAEAPATKRRAGFDRRGFPVFWATLGGSLLLSWLLISVFHLPIFILGAFLPLFWWSRTGK